MKDIPLLLLDKMERRGRSMCFLVKVVERTPTGEGPVWGFASVDKRLVFNDGTHTVSYDPAQELRPQNIQNTHDMELDNTELSGWFNEVIEQRVISGNFNSAQVTVYRVAYFDLAAGAEIIAYGEIGKVDYSASSKNKRKMEFISLTKMLKLKQNDQYSLTCRNDFGDDHCGMPFVWHAATVVQVEDNLMRFKISGVSQPDDYFQLGMVVFDDGANATYDMEVESWTADGWVTLSFVTPYEITVGTNLRIRQDCLKTATACKAYGNIVNMDAEHLTPVQDQSLMVPGAYVKSQNAL